MRAILSQGIALKNEYIPENLKMAVPLITPGVCFVVLSYSSLEPCTIHPGPYRILVSLSSTITPGASTN
jgi:hypothetical protein